MHTIRPHGFGPARNPRSEEAPRRYRPGAGYGSACGRAEFT